jgi:tRNA A-37 threonylcarbamoyl transferase component Bud32
MSEESDDLDKVFESVADGESVDWDALERGAPDEESRALLRQLRLIAEVAEVHRSQVDEVPTPDADITAPVALPGGTWPPPPRVPHVGTRPTPDEGSAWGHLLLVRKIGEGSYGEVYHAHDTWLDHPVALKLLKPEAEDRVQPSDLLHEARKLARVRHSNVVTVHGADRHNGRVGFWMDFIDGETLAARVTRGRMSSGEATSVGQEVCRALAAVHRANIIHRDVKAQNVMRAHDGGRIILMDFGAGQFVDDRSSRAQGTPLYLAPEVLRGEDATPRSDIYAAGVLLFHLVTGRYPVESASPRDLIEAHERGERRRLRDERPDLPESFITIVERAIDPDSMRRYASAGEMEAKLSGEPVTRPVVVAPLLHGPRSPIVTYLKRAVIAVAILFALLVGFGFVAAKGFEIVLRVDPDFALGFTGILGVGVEALIPFVVYGAFGAAMLGGIYGLQLWLRSFLSSRWDRLVAFSNSWDPVVTAATIVLVSAASWIVLNTVVFADYFGALYMVMGDPATRQDLSILGSGRHDVHLNHFYLSLCASMLLLWGVWRWFPALERRTTSLATVRGLKWAAVTIAITFLAWVVLPRRIVWEQYPVVEFDNRMGFVIGTAGEELLFYAPDEPGRPRRRIRPDAPGFRRTAETRFLFDGESGRQP